MSDRKRYPSDVTDEQWALKRTAHHAGVASLVMAAMMGCTSNADQPSPFQRAAMPESQARLGDAVMAFSVGPLNEEMTTAGSANPGYVALVNADGSFRTIKTDHMDMMRLAWSDHGLYFGDKANDYRLTPTGLTKSANPKAIGQNLIFPLASGGSVGVYNAGFDDLGYLNQVTINDDGNAARNDVQGNYYTGALCDGQVFGLTNMPGTHESKRPQRPEMTLKANPTATPQMLALLHPAGRGGKLVAWRPQFGYGTPIGEVPCDKNVITFLSWDTDSNGSEKPAVVSWDTRTGASRAHPLTFDDSTYLSPEDFGYVVQDLDDGLLSWVYADGRVFSTEATTGRTKMLFDTKLGTGPSRPALTKYEFSDTQLHALSTIPGGQGNIVYSVFDRASGKSVREVPIPISNGEINVSYLSLSHIAVRPQP